MVEVEKTSLRRTRRWLGGGVVGLFPLVAACSSGADADESQPTVFEGDSSQQDNEQAEAVPERTDESDDSLNGDELDEDETPEPVPASSEGPAENWPEPEIPDEIYEPTEEGAEALIQYWFDARHHARITGEVKPWIYVTHTECAVCQTMIKRTEDVYPEGWYVAKSDTVLESHVSLDDEFNATGLFRLEQARFEAHWEGQLHSSTPGDPESSFGYAMLFAEGRWQMYDLSVISLREESDASGGR